MAEKGYDVATAYIRIMPSTSKFGSALKGDMETEGKTAGGHFSSGFSTGLKILGAATAAASAAVGKVVKDAVQEFAEYEQLVGGVQKLFGDIDYTAVVDNAQEAFRTAGMSANEYMETVTSFSASLISSLEGDTTQAVDYADKALRDMSDNANVFGTDMQSIQNAYQGFAKQNYTMLDNLKLGYGGTKTEMERLVSDAEKLDASFVATRDENGKLTLSFSDIVDAIHIVQENMNITGTTAKEASQTTQGSVGSMKAAWHNLLLGLSDDTQDFGKLVNDFVGTLIGTENETGERVGGVINNILPRVTQALEGVGELVKTLVPELVGYIPDLLEAVLPGLLEGASALVQSFLAELPNIIGVIAEQLPTLLSGLGDAIITGFQSLTENLPALADSLSGVLSSILTYITENAGTLIDTVADFLSTLLTEGIRILSENTTEIIDALWAVVKAVVQAAMEHPELIAAILGMQALKKIGGTIVSAIGSGILGAKDQITGAVQGAVQSSTTAAGVGTGLGIAAAAGAVGYGIGTLITNNADLQRSNDLLSQSIMNVMEQNGLLYQSLSGAEEAFAGSIKGADDNAAYAYALYKNLLKVNSEYDGSLEKKTLIEGMVDELNRIVPGLSATWDEYTGELSLNSEEIGYQIEMMRSQAKVAAAQQLYIEAIKDSAMANNQLKEAQSNLNDIIARAGITMDEYNGYIADGEVTALEIAEIWLKGGIPAGTNLVALYKDMNEAAVGNSNALALYNKSQQDVETAELALTEAIQASQEATESHARTMEEAQQKETQAVTDFGTKWSKILTIDMPESMQTAVQSATDAGVQIPQQMVYGIERGDIDVDNAVNRINELVRFDEAIETAGVSGVTVSQDFIDNWLAGAYNLPEAEAYYTSFLNFNDAIQNALDSGQEVDEQFVAGLLDTYGLTAIVNAADVLDETATPKPTRKSRPRRSGQETTQEFAGGIVSGIAGVSAAAGAIYNSVTGTIDTLPAEMGITGTSAGQQLDSGFGGTSGSISSTIDSIWNLYYQVLGQLLPGKMWEWGYNAGTKFFSGLGDISSTAESLYYNAGTYAGYGFYMGLYSWASNIRILAWNIAVAAANAARAALSIRSPSRVMMEIGEYTGEGFALGIEESTDRAIEAAADMATSTATTATALIDAVQSDTAHRTSDYELITDADTDGADIVGYMSQILALMDKLSHMQMVTDTGALVGEMAPELDRAYSAIRIREGRG